MSTTAVTPATPPASAPSPAEAARQDIHQRISCDLRVLTCVGLICSIALAILFAASSQNIFAYLSIAGTGVIFRSYQEIQLILDPPGAPGTDQLNLFKLTQIKMGQLVTFIGDSLTAAGRYLSG